jgi:hypothetical protein
MEGISKSPWKIESPSSIGVEIPALVWSADGIAVADCNIFAAKRTDEENIANARLIASAPEMFNLLKLISERNIFKDDAIGVFLSFLIDRLEQH